MKKKIGVVLCSLFLLGITAYQAKDEILRGDSLSAATNDDFPAITFNQYAKFRISPTQSFTALNNKGSFLSNEVTTADPVFFPTTALDPITDSRNASFITETSLPKYADVLGTIDTAEDKVNDSIPKTGKWWLNDISTVNETLSAKIIQQDTLMLSDASFVLRDSENNPILDWKGDVKYIWKGYLPTESKGYGTVKIKEFYNSDINSNAFFHNGVGYANDFRVATEFTGALDVDLKVCGVNIVDEKVLSCDSDVGTESKLLKLIRREENYNYETYLTIAKVDLDFDNQLLSLSLLPEDKKIHAGDIIIVRVENYAADGYVTGSSDQRVVAFVSAEDLTIPEEFVNSSAGNAQVQEGDARYLLSKQNQAAELNYGIYENVEVEPQKAYIRPKVKVDTSQIAYIVNENSVTGNLDEEHYTQKITAPNINTTYTPIVKDSSLEILGLRNQTSGDVKVDAQNNKVTVKAGTQYATIPINTSTLNENYHRIIEMNYVTIDANGKEMILSHRLGQMNTENGQITIDLSKEALGTEYDNFDYNKVGDKIVLPLYVEDLAEGKTGYISTTPYNIEVEIVENSSISFEKKPGAINGQPSEIYKFNKNVLGGTKIGEVHLAGGAAPYTLALVDDDANSGAYQYFELAQTSDITTTSVDVRIKNNSEAIDSSTNSLKAGTYNFCITSDDIDEANEQQKTCTSITVNKATPSISFNTDDQDITYVIGSSTETTEYELAASYMNAANGNGDAGIEYTKVSGTSGLLLSGLPHTELGGARGAILTFAPNTYGQIVVKATLSGNDNYEAVSTTKTIVVISQLHGVYSEDIEIEPGTDSAKPQPYIEENRIGHVAVSGGTAPYTYSLPEGVGENGSFHIDDKGNVYINSAVGTNGLVPGEYPITVEVTDQSEREPQVIAIEHTIAVGVASANGIAFEKPDKEGEVVTDNKIEVTYDPSKNGGSFSTKLIEVNEGALVSTVVTFSLDPSDNDVVSLQATENQADLTVLHANTTDQTVKLIAEVTGGIYGTSKVTKEVEVRVLPYKQEIAYEDTSILRLPLGGDCVSVTADITSDYYLEDEELLYTASYEPDIIPFTLNGDQQVCPTSDPSQAGRGQLRGHLNGNRDYKAAMTVTEKVIEVYEPSELQVTGSIERANTVGVEYIPDEQLIVANDSAAALNGTAKINTTVAQIQDMGSVAPAYELSDKETPENTDQELFKVEPDGSIKLKQNISAIDLVNHPTGNRYRIQVNATDDHGVTTLVDINIKIANAKAVFYFVNSQTNAQLPLDALFTDNETRIASYQATYEANGTITVATNRANISFNEHNEGDLDVIEQSNRGIFTMMNASDLNGTYGTGGKTYVRACMSEGAGYAEQCIYTQVIVNKAEQSTFAFVNHPTWNMERSSASISPSYTGKLSSGQVTLSSSNTAIAEVDELVEGQDQGFTLKNAVGTSTLTATSPANRNYKTATATTTLNVSDELPETLTISAGAITYGDENVTPRITSGYRDHLPVYFYTSDSTILSANTQSVNSDTANPMRATGSGQVVIHACQTSEAFDPANDDCLDAQGYYGEITVNVAKKPISFTFDDQEIYTGEEFPEFTFTTVTANAFAFNDTITSFTIPTNTQIRRGNTVIVDSGQVGEYQIHGSYSATEANQNVIKNYQVTFVDGTMNIEKDTPSSSWYEAQNAQGEPLSQQAWYKEPITIAIKQAQGNAGIYNQISDDAQFFQQDASKLIIDEEGQIRKDLYFRIDPTGNVNHAGAIAMIASPQYNIDYTKPQVSNMTGYKVNDDGLSEFLNKLTLGQFFQIGMELEVTATDPQPQAREAVVVSGLDHMLYKVYELNNRGEIVSSTPVSEGEKAFSRDGKATVKMDDIGNYRMCVIAYDVAGNDSRQECSDVIIRKVDVDADGDGTLDFNDTNGDGYPDFNIIWSDPDNPNEWIKLNVDTNNDLLPDMNIDADGDGIADLNIDTNHDNIPDTSLVVMTKELWNPTKIVSDQPEEYATGTSATAQLNIMQEGEQASILNIDNQGDFKAHLNITTDSDKQKPIVNIVDLHEWEPTKTYTYQGFKYQSIDSEVTAQRNIDSNDNLIPDLSLDFDDDRIPEVNVDTNGDGKPNFNVDIDGDGIADVNLDKTGDDGIPDEKIIHITTWEPDKQGTYRGITFETMAISGSDQLENNGVIVEKPEEQFPIDYDLQVEDVTEQLLESVQTEAKDLIGENEIKHIYAMKLLYNNVETALDGSVNVKVKIPDSIKNPIVLVRRSNGTFEIVDAKVEDGYVIYQTNELGIMSVLEKPNSGDDPIVNPDDPSGGDDPIVNPDDPSGGDDPIVNPDDPSAGDDPIVNPDNPSGGDDPIVNPDNPSGGDQPIVKPDNPSGSDDPVVNPDDSSNGDDKSNPDNPTSNPNDSNNDDASINGSNTQTNSSSTVKGTYNKTDSSGGASTGDDTMGMTYMSIMRISLSLLVICMIRKRKQA